MSILSKNILPVNQLHETEPRWFAVRTRAKSEKAVQRSLAKKGVHAYVPLQAFVRRYERKTRTVALPLIAGYAFVFLIKSQYVNVLETQNVVSFVKNGGDLLAIPDTEIELLRRVTLEKELEISAVPGALQAGDQVEIAAGSLTGLRGRLVKIEGKKQVQVELERLGYSLLITIQADWLREVTGK